MRNHCIPLHWNDRDLLSACINDQNSRYIIHRLLCLVCLYLLSLPKVIKEEQVRLEYIEGSVGDPGVELPRALLTIEALDAPLLGVVHLHDPTVQPRSLESWI